jgi:hypothetical protein
LHTVGVSIERRNSKWSFGIATVIVMCPMAGEIQPVLYHRGGLDDILWGACYKPAA